MTMTEHEARIAELIERYNKALNDDVVDMRKMNGIEAELKAATVEAKKDKKKEVYGHLYSTENPMLEAARVHHFDYPAYVFTKDNGEVTGVEAATKTANISPVEFSAPLIKEAETKSCRYERIGVVKSGRCWEYRAEKLAYMLTFRTIKKLGGSPTEIEEFRHTYAIRDLAARENLGQTPTSNTQIVKMLQSIIDMLVFVPNEKGANSVKANAKDVEYLLAMFEKAGRGTGVVEVLKGNKVKDYIFTVCHMIVTGKAYEVKYAKKKENADANVTIIRKPVEGKKKAAKKVEASDTMEIARPKKAKAEEVSDVETDMPGMDDIPESEIA